MPATIDCTMVLVGVLHRLHFGAEMIMIRVT